MPSWRPRNIRSMNSMRRQQKPMYDAEYYREVKLVQLFQVSLYKQTTVVTAASLTDSRTLAELLLGIRRSVSNKGIIEGALDAWGFGWHIRTGTQRKVPSVELPAAM